MNTHPKTAKGSSRLYEVSAAFWFDLLGYGSMLERVNFDPTKEEAQLAIKRLNDFHDFLAEYSSRYFPIHAINDGAISFRDLSPRARSVTFDFLDRSLNLFQKFNEYDRNKGFPGARMIIAAGFRVRVKENDVNSDQHYVRNIKKKIKLGAYHLQKSKNRPYKTKTYFGVLPQLQANFAFTKAYLVDATGSKGGFGGPNCFIDLSFFNQDLNNWISFEKIIDWQDKGMKSQFGLFKSSDREAANKSSHRCVLDAFEIAEKISNQDGITNVLKKNTLKENAILYR
jgi:hypothetical protein